MKTKFVNTVLALAIISGALVIGTNFAQCHEEKGYISINTSASTELAPDLAELSFTVTTSDSKTMQNATLENRKIVDKVMVVLNKYIDKNNGDYIKTSNYNASPVYTYKDSKRIFDRYDVSNSVIVHTKALENIGKMIDESISAGATNVNNLTFTVSNYEKQCNDLISEATQKAKNRAESISKALVQNLGGVRTYDSSCSINSYSSRVYMAKNMLSAVADGVSVNETTVSGGEIKLNANVNVTFFVK